MKEGIKPPDMDMSTSEMYKNAKDLFSAELSTLSQRTNFFLVTQSVLIGALAFAFQNSFPYLFPYIISLLVLGGIIFSLLTYRSGREASESLMRWRLYMKYLEKKLTFSPWNWYYESYNEKHVKEKENIIDNTPLPYMWLFFPIIFSVMWLLISSYIPARLWVDKSFLIVGGHDYRCLAGIASLITMLIAAGSIVYLICKYREWRNTTYKLPEEVE